MGKKVIAKLLDGRRLKGRAISWMPSKNQYTVEYDGQYIPPTGDYYGDQLELIPEVKAEPKETLYCKCENPTIKPNSIMKEVFYVCTTCKKEFLKTPTEQLLEDFEAMLSEEF